jgi:hypothetical protein
MISSLLIIGFIWNLLVPLPPGIAINPETKECGQYFGGDEFGGFVLPSPWEVIYDPTIQKDSGMVQWEGSVEGYCQQIGYTYIEGNLGEIYGQQRKSIIYYIFLLVKIAPLILIIAVISIGYSLYSKRMKKRGS